MSVIFAFLLSISTVCWCSDNGVARLPYMGWTTWCTDNYLPIPCFDDYCDEAEVKSVAQSIVTNGLDKLGYQWLLLDDCWAATNRSASGQLMADKTRFPSGSLKPLADYVHSLGLKLGAYTDVGPKTCRGNRMGSWPFYQQDAITFAKWGLDMVKMDWCDHPGSFTQQQLYTNFSNALNATGKPILFNICGWGLNDVWLWAPPISNSWRIGPDHIPLWWWFNTTQDPGEGQGTLNIIEHFRNKSQYSGPGGWNDADFLEPGYAWNGEAADQTEFSFWSLVNSPLIVATDIRDLSNKQCILNAEVIAVNQDPLGIAGDVVFDDKKGSQIWSRPLSRARWAVILFNDEIFSLFTHVQPTLLFTDAMLSGWPSSAHSATVRDLWQRKDLGQFNGSFQSRPLAARESQMIIVTPV